MEKTRYSKTFRAAAISILVLTFPLAVRAQSAGAQAEALFREGKRLMAAGKVAEACAAFDASQKLDPTVTTLLNQADCREKNGQLATAWGLFLEVNRLSRTASDAAGKQMRVVAAQRAARLEPRLSTLRIDVPAENRIGGLEILRDGDVLDPATWDKPLPIDGGTYRISARAPGNAEWSSSVTVAPERDARALEVPKLRPADLGRLPPGAQHERAERAGPLPAPTSAPREPGGVWSTRRKLAVGIAGGGVLAIAAGGVLGVSAKSQQRDAHALCPDPQLVCDQADRANELVRSGHARALGANVAFGVGAAAMITAGVLWLTGAPESRGRIEVVPSASPEQVFVTASRSF
ncbi:MAG TPA: tetratricopeptide repeat protein [Kofleriaceae bacterium]|nr:tetratricopeptide repeat protein [Kofleriaceae bacterium]